MATRRCRSVIKEEVVDDKRHGIAVIAEVVCVDLWEVVCVFDVCSGIIAVLEYVGLLLSSVNRFSVCSKTLWGWFEIWQLIPFEIFFFFSFRHRRGAGPRPVRPNTFIRDARVCRRADAYVAKAPRVGMD